MVVVCGFDGNVGDVDTGHSVLICLRIEGVVATGRLPHLHRAIRDGDKKKGL